jgi:hypothetical protein
VSDVIVLREAIPETADVVAPLDARHQPRFRARCGGAVDAGATNLKKRVTRPAGGQPGDPAFCSGRYSHPRGGLALKVGKAHANQRMERSLYQRGVGYSFDSVKVFMPAGAKKRAVERALEASTSSETGPGEVPGRRAF